MNCFFRGLGLFILTFAFSSFGFAEDNLDTFLQEYNPSFKKYKLQYKVNGEDITESENRSIFGRYCEGSVNNHRPPTPKYSNGLVRKAAANIAKTDRKAKEVLTERAIQKMKEDMARALNVSNQLKESKNQTVKSQATALATQIESTSEFNDSMERKAKRISVALTAQIKGLIDELVVKLENDLTGIDNVQFKQAVIDLDDGLNADLERVSFQKLKEVNARIRSTYQSLEGQANKDVVKAQAEIISMETGIYLDENPDSWSHKYMKESADSLIVEIDANGMTENATYLMQDILYHYENEDMEHSTASVAAGKKMGKEHVKNRAKAVVDQTKELDETIASADESSSEGVQNVNYSARQVRYRIDPLSPWVSSEVIEANKAFNAEVDKFLTTNILANSKQTRIEAEAENWPTAHANAQRMTYDIQQIQDSLKPATRDAFERMSKELAKLQSERIKQQAKDLKEKLAPLADIEDEQSWDVQSFANSLNNQSLNLTTAKEDAEAYIAASNEMRNSQELKSLTKTRIEDAQPGMHYYFYGHVWKHYKGGQNKPSWVSWNAHKFIKQLCGEYRDRATMIEAKLKWIANGLYILPKKEEAGEVTINAQTKNVWSKVNAEWYYPYIDVADSLWNARRDAQERYIKVGSITAESSKVDNPVKGTTVCETKFIFAEYVSKNKNFDNLESFNEGYETFKSGCPIADRKDYYDFRGDSNFKHYSPESNGMIWYANNLARACRRTNSVKPSAQNYTSGDCKRYFENPFAMRYAGARAIFASWLFRDPQYDEVFGNSNSMVAIYSHRAPRLAPYSFGFDQNSLEYKFEFDPEWQGIPLENSWLKGDMGYNKYTGLEAGASASDEAKVRAFTLISNAVDRHTDWYSSGYNDGNGFVRDQATSPFVASSYVMSSSDSFTTCGITVQCPPDGLKRWMFVFRIKGDNWYGPDRIEKGDAIDFDRHWFDETSFGQTGLADSEHAWDRLGTALEEELDSILYLVNVDGGGHFDGDGH